MCSTQKSKTTTESFYHTSPLICVVCVNISHRSVTLNKTVALEWFCEWFRHRSNRLQNEQEEKKKKQKKEKNEWNGMEDDENTLNAIAL